MANPNLRCETALPVTGDGERLPFTVIGGYLGAGKTTLVNRLLREAEGRRLAVIVNDFGDVNIDSAMIESHDGATLSLTNGCVCCSIADGFLAALDTVCGLEPRPDHVVVEVSGVGDPWRVAQWGRTPRFLLDGVVVLVDAVDIVERAGDPRVGETIVDQLARADLVIVTKPDLVGTDRIAAVQAWLDSVTSATVLVPGDEPVPIPVLLGVGGSRSGDGRGDRPHAAHWTRTIALRAPLDRHELEQVLASAPDDLVRAKGFVQLAETPTRRHVVQRVGARTELTVAGSWERTDRARLVLVGIGAEPPAAVVDWMSSIPSRR